METSLIESNLTGWVYSITIHYSKAIEYKKDLAPSSYGGRGHFRAHQKRFVVASDAHHRVGDCPLQVKHALGTSNDESHNDSLHQKERRKTKPVNRFVYRTFIISC